MMLKPNKVSPIFRAACWVLASAPFLAVHRAFQMKQDGPLWEWIIIVPLFVFWIYLFGYTAWVGSGPTWLATSRKKGGSSLDPSGQSCKKDAR